MRVQCFILILLGQALLLVAAFSPPLPTYASLDSRRESRFRITPLMSLSPVPKTGRRELLGIGLLGLGSLPIAFPEAANAGTPVRAPLPNGPPDPSDWAKLIEATKLVETWGEELEDAASWDGISKVVQKEPFTQESMDLMFRKAAKNLPPNALLGTDAGYWAGVRVEAMEALDAFSVEVQYLNNVEKKRKGSADSSDLKGYQEQLLTKMKEFIAIKDDVKVCKLCAGQGGPK